MLARSSTPRAVIIVSTASLLPISRGTVAACLAGDEQRAVDAARAAPGEAYMSSKYALGQWIRREAVTPRWAGRRMTLNGVSPGVTNTMMIKRAMEMPNGLAMLTNSTPRATPMIGQPEDLAEPIAWLATMDTAYIAGQILWVDGGTEAILRPDIL
jgi:NAD(P)-dependent dehydrogenase (short-subunit alcohol dehydrogenase family)